MLKATRGLSKYLINRTVKSHCMSAPLRVVRAMSTKKIGTHDGVFHCDEVLACAMLRMLPEYGQAEVVRSREPTELDKCDIVVDVGGIFDHGAKRYDHHQRGFEETLSTLRPELGDKYKIKLSSAGLIYTYYGERIIRELTPSGTTLRPDDLNIIFTKVYEALIQEVDAIDNGIPIVADGEPEYTIRTHLSNRIARLNPGWNTVNPKPIYQLFRDALVIVSNEFWITVNEYITSWLPARDNVRNALEARYQVHESGQILIFEQGRYPWKEHLCDLESNMALGHSTRFVVFAENPNSWRVQAVPVTPTSFVLRKPLQREWWGLRDDGLSAKAGVAGCIFCHANGFIGGNETLEGALRMAELSLDPADS